MRHRSAISQTASLAADMNQAAAVAELVGSPLCQRHARAIYDNAKACADVFQFHELILAAAPAEWADEMVGGKIFSGVFRRKHFDRIAGKKISEVFSVSIQPIHLR